MARLITLLAATLLACEVTAGEPNDIGSRRELFVDDYLVESLTGDAAIVLNRPAPREAVLVTDKPWEGNISAYYTVFRDGELFRMYYRGAHYDEAAKASAHREVTCYAESRDGVHWTRPDLGLFEFNGSKQNNIVLDGLGTHCFTPFKDANPKCPAAARYKAISAGYSPAAPGLYIFQSPDGIHWSQACDKPVITKGAFDSQNLAFWDESRGCYLDFHRTFHEGVRDIMTCRSDDFVNWTEPALLEYTGSPREHLYTNAIMPYQRAPHLLIGFPTRYLPNEGERVEPTFMSSRDGRTFHRWQEAVIPPDAPQDRRGNRSNYMAWGLVQLPGDDRELSVYGTEAYYTGASSRLRRFTYRVDGFTAVRSGGKGQLTSKPLLFAGRTLTVNFRTSGKGSIRAELQSEDGKSLRGLALADCRPLQGDEIEAAVKWESDADLGALAGKPVRLCFELDGAELFSFRFAP